MATNLYEVPVILRVKGLKCVVRGCGKHTPPEIEVGQGHIDTVDPWVEGWQSISVRAKPPGFWTLAEGGLCPDHWIHYDLLMKKLKGWGTYDREVQAVEITGLPELPWFKEPK